MRNNERRGIINSSDDLSDSDRSRLIVSSGREGRKAIRQSSLTQRAKAGAVALALPGGGFLCIIAARQRTRKQRRETGRTISMRRIIASIGASAVAALTVAGVYAQGSGTISKAVGGYSFADAAKEGDATKNFHSADGHLTFAIVTHTAGNGFFDPVYVGATAAGNLIGAKILLLGSESPTDDPQREIEILNQITQDPTIDGLIMTTPQAGAYNDIVKAAEKNGIPVATTNSFDPT